MGSSANNSQGELGTTNTGKAFPTGTRGSYAEWEEAYPEGSRSQNGHGGPVITPKQKSQSNEINREAL